MQYCISPSVGTYPHIPTTQQQLPGVAATLPARTTAPPPPSKLTVPATTGLTQQELQAAAEHGYDSAEYYVDDGGAGGGEFDYYGEEEDEDYDDEHDGEAADYVASQEGKFLPLCWFCGFALRDAMLTVCSDRVWKRNCHCALFFNTSILLPYMHLTSWLSAYLFLLGLRRITLCCLLCCIILCVL